MKRGLSIANCSQRWRPQRSRDDLVEVECNISQEDPLRFVLVVGDMPVPLDVKQRHTLELDVLNLKLVCQ